MTKYEKLKLCILGNMIMIQDLLEKEGIESKYKDCSYYSVNRDNSELRQRLKQLRRESIQLEKELYK